MSVRNFLTTVERKAFDILKPIAEKHEYEVFPKPRFADAVSLKNSGVCGRDFTYALQAHLDFVLVCNNSVCFAIEIDGPNHFMDNTVAARDLRKNSLCIKLGLDLLRIDANYFHELQEQTVLSLLVEEIVSRRKSKTRTHSRSVPSSRSYLAYAQSMKDHRLALLEQESKTILNRVEQCENKLYTFRTQENEFFYTANILESRKDKYVIGQGCAHSSNVLAEDPQVLADQLSLLDLNKRLNLPLDQIDPAVPKTFATELRNSYECTSEFPTVRMKMLKYTGQLSFPDAAHY